MVKSWVWLKETCQTVPKSINDFYTYLIHSKKIIQEKILSFFGWSSIIMVNRTLQTYCNKP